jgi:cell cycle serine/threonine-protein kinase CDC5/MSD2
MFQVDRRIRDNEYDFPTDRVISTGVQHLIQQILTPIPSQRPTLHEIVDHLFFTRGPVPSYIPTMAHDSAPDFSHISKATSDTNLRRLRKYALLDIDQNAIPPSGMPTSMSSGGLSASKNITNSIAQQEKEFQKAVQPGSPISALLSSARQPLLMSMGTTGAGPAGARESPLLRKLQAVKESPLGRTVTRGLDGIIEENEPQGKRRVEEEDQQKELRLRKKELEAQKARIVAQMAPVREEQEEPDVHPRVAAAAAAPAPPIVPSKPNGFDAAAQTLSIAFDARAAGRIFRDPQSHLLLPDERVFIVSWVDYCNKYGMGYALTDGSVGVHFNDSTSLVLSPDKV